MKINISEAPTDSLKKLFWSVFFESKNRGISLGRHFPWLESGPEIAIFFEIVISSDAVAGLVLRHKEYQIHGEPINIGIIGLVCVAPEHRGVGISHKLLAKVIDYSQNNNYDYLTLWTNQHHIYSKHKFYVADPWLYGWVKTDVAVKKLACDNVFNKALIIENTLSPLPPFATGLYEYSSNNSSFGFLKDKDGEIVINYKGDVVELGLLMINELPERWRLNVIKNDPLIAVLLNYGAIVKVSPVNLQMWLSMRESNQSDLVINSVVIPILDRI